MWFYSIKNQKSWQTPSSLPFLHLCLVGYFNTYKRNQVCEKEYVPFTYLVTLYHLKRGGLTRE